MISSCLDREDYIGSMGGLYSLNALLPAEYRVKVSTEEFNELTKVSCYMICKHCSKEFKDVEIKISNLLKPYLFNCLTREKYEKVWRCPGCKKESKLKDTEFKQEKIGTYNYLHVMPEPPKREDGLMDRRYFKKNMQIWVWTFMGELEERCGKLRHDFLNREDSMLEEITDEG